MKVDIASLLGDDAAYLLDHVSTTISVDQLTTPGPDSVTEVFGQSDRPPQVLRNLQCLLDHGRLAGTGHVSILPVDQGIEHSAAASFAPNPAYMDPANIVELAMEGGCNAVASTFGVLATMSRRFAHRIPFIVKVNHN
ncbi:MAG: fructose-bisphosphate aldolase, partial [Actinomycetota bacterium]|nr:fructose-bisphosphate aldolase [Actinomycetota bacterium]